MTGPFTHWKKLACSILKLGYNYTLITGSDCMTRASSAHNKLLSSHYEVEPKCSEFVKDDGDVGISINGTRQWSKLIVRSATNMPISHYQQTTINTFESPSLLGFTSASDYDMVSNLPGRSRIRGPGKQENVCASGLIAQRFTQCHSSAPVREINTQERSLYFSSCVPYSSSVCLCWTNSTHPGPTFQDMQPPESHP